MLHTTTRTGMRTLAGDYREPTSAGPPIAGSSPPRPWPRPPPPSGTSLLAASRA